MTQSSKRPGAKDISDLKARLGLKKNGPAAAKPAGLGGFAPPGARPAGGIPAPPGAAPPKPHIPDAKADPFGAMNAIAAHGAAQAQAPQIVVVNDGTPVEQMQKKTRARIAVIGGIAALALIFGVAVGKISAGANAYNRTIEDSAKIRDDIKKTRDGLIGYQQVLANAKSRNKGGLGVSDAKLTAALKAMPPLEPNIEVVFASHMYDLPAELVGATLSFYVEVIELNDLIKKHVEMASDEEKAIKEGMVAAQGFNPFGYAGLIEVPSQEEQQKGKMVAMKIVQLGQPICEGETKPSETGCKGKVSGFRYRTDELGPWGIKKVSTPEDDNVTADSLVVFDPSSKVLQQIVKGGKPTVAEASYAERITKIDERINDLIEREKAIETRLNSKANESARFSFFM